jgi:hypothetical protein
MNILRKSIQAFALGALTLLVFTLASAQQVRLKLVDGSTMEVDEASESEQGICRQFDCQAPSSPAITRCA